ncbi:MAG: tetratricopeptide repeat protein [Pseudomonadota bacterium]
MNKRRCGVAHILPAVLYILGCTSGVEICLNTLPSSKVSERVLKSCETAANENWNRSDLFHRYVALLVLRGQYEEMLQFSRYILGKDSRRTDARYSSAVALRKMGRYSEAIQDYEVYAKQNKHDADPYFGLALCYEEIGDRESAIASYQRYLEKEVKGERKTWREKARQRIAMMQNEEPVVENTTVAKQTELPTQLDSRHVAPLTKIDKKAQPLPSQDCDVYKNEISANPFATETYEKFVNCAVQESLYTEIVKFMRIALRDIPGFSRGWLHLGNAYKALGKHMEARAAFTKACAAHIFEACDQ